MFWSALFTISIAQGLFLVSVIAWRAAKNTLASRLIIAMLLIMILTNFGYLVIRTDLLHYIPGMFALPFGMMLLFGPLFYLYSRSVVDSSFRWKPVYWLHFVPYLLQLLHNMPMFLLEKKFMIEFINYFLAGEAPIRGMEKVIFVLQDLHLLIYLFFTFRWMRSAGSMYASLPYNVPFAARMKWLRELFYCLSLFLLTVVSLYVIVMINGKYDPVTNYLYTCVTTCIIYFIAYKLVLHPGLVIPDFTQKYKTYMPFSGEEGEKYLRKLKQLMEESKLFTNPDLKLSVLAEALELPAHQVSKLINEKLGRSFNDFVNEYRVREFIARLNDPRYESYTIFGIALDVGFNSKSAFNAAFKKITGTTPSAYKAAN